LKEEAFLMKKNREVYKSEIRLRGEERKTLSYRATILLNPKRLVRPKAPGPEFFPSIIADKTEQILAAFAGGKMDALKQRVEEILKEKSLDVKAFLPALELSKAGKVVERDMVVGNKIGVTTTPTEIVNEDIIVGSTPDDV
jgi:hypothetical protein